MEGAGGSSRELARKLSKIRFTQDIVGVDDFMSDEFKAEHILEKVASRSGVFKFLEESSYPPSSVSGGGTLQSSGQVKTGPWREDTSPIKKNGRSDDTHPSQSIDTVQRLLLSCIEMVSRLEELQERVGQESESLQLALSADHAGYSSRISKTEKQLNHLESIVESLEKQADDLVTFGQNVGRPFAELKNQKEQATKLADILDHLTIFAHCTDLSMLPPSFHNDEDIEKSASTVQALMTAIQSVADMEHCSNAGDIQSKKQPGSEAQRKDQLGTLGAAWEQLLLYLNVLDNRIVSHFDNAADSKDIAAMAYYKRVMDLAHGSFTNGSLLLMSRYISRKKLFFSPEELLEKLDLQDEEGNSTPEAQAARVHGFDSRGHVEASRRITYVCNHLLGQIRDETSVLEQIFGNDSSKAVSLFISRVFEETLSEAVQRAFSRAHFGDEETTTELRESLRLVSEAYRKVYNLADEARHLISNNEENCPPAEELVDSAMGNIVVAYPDLERRWHRLLGISTVNDVKKMNGNMETDIVLNLISMNEESINRCSQIMPVNKRSSFIQNLFYCNPLPSAVDTTSRTSLMSLLDYIGKYLMQNLQLLEQRFPKQLDNHSLWRDTVIDSKVIKSTIEQSFGTVAKSIVSASEVLKDVKEHYTNDIAPLLPPEEKSPLKALLVLQRGIEDHISMILQGCVDFLCSKIRDMLHAFQLKSHFLMDGSNTAEIELPTPPCSKACAIVSEVISCVDASLVSNNYVSFVQVLVKSLEVMLEAHFLKFYYTPGGALRLKQDIAAYSACMAASRVPSARRAFDDLAAMSNILVVGTLSVHEMVESVSYLGEGRVSSFLKRRYEK